jgi:hypothetical protein
MTPTTIARDCLIEAAGPWTRELKRPDWLRLAARALGIPATLATAIYYRKRKRLFADEYQQLIDNFHSLQQRRQQLESEHAALKQRLDALSDRSADPDGGAARPPRLDDIP